MKNKQMTMDEIEQLKDVYLTYVLDLVDRGDLIEAHHKVINLAKTLRMGGSSIHLACLATACGNAAETIYENLQWDENKDPQNEVIDECYCLESIIDRNEF